MKDNGLVVTVQPERLRVELKGRERTDGKVVQFRSEWRFNRLNHLGPEVTNAIQLVCCVVKQTLCFLSTVQTVSRNKSG